MSKASKGVINWRKRTKARLIEAFGKKCALCNNEYPDELYDFHHIVPAEKEFSFGKVRAKCISWKRIVKEIKKCAMVCSNCHRLLHHGYKVLPENYNQFNNDYTKYELFDKHPCKVCGKDISEYKKVCGPACSARLSGSIDWGKINILSLLDKYGNMTEVARILDVSHGTIWKRVKKEKAYLICPVCGKEKDKNNKTCSLDCNGKLTRKVDWDNIDVIKLLEKHNYNYTQAGRELDVSDNAVRKRYKKVMTML